MARGLSATKPHQFGTDCLSALITLTFLPSKSKVKAHFFQNRDHYDPLLTMSVSLTCKYGYMVFMIPFM